MGSLRRVAAGRPAAAGGAAPAGRRPGARGSSTALFAAVAALGSVLLLLGGALNTPGAMGQAYLVSRRLLVVRRFGAAFVLRQSLRRRCLGTQIVKSKQAFGYRYHVPSPAGVCFL